MCGSIFGGSSSSKKPPPPPEPVKPPPIPEAPKAGDARGVAAREDTRRRAAIAGGVGQDVRTSALGAPGPVPTKKKKLGE